MLAVLTTLAHFPVSSAMNLLKSTVDLVNGVPPASRSVVVLVLAVALPQPVPADTSLRRCEVRGASRPQEHGRAAGLRARPKRLLQRYVPPWATTLHAQSEPFAFRLAIRQKRMNALAQQLPTPHAGRVVCAVLGAMNHSMKIGDTRGAKGRAAASQEADARAADLAPIIARLQASGVTSLYGIAKALTALAVPTPGGTKKWQGLQVRRVLARLSAGSAPGSHRFPRSSIAMGKGGIGQEERRVLRLLARSSNGHTEAMLQAHGVTNEMLGRLVIDGLATATPQIVHAGKWPLKVVRMRITDAGRQAVAE
jgi:hypothetical protein